jgi:hypothetical protein
MYVTLHLVAKGLEFFFFACYNYSSECVHCHNKLLAYIVTYDVWKWTRKMEKVCRITKNGCPTRGSVNTTKVEDAAMYF